MGFGASAHSYTNNVRFSNIDSIEDYIANYKNDNVTDNFYFSRKAKSKQSNERIYDVRIKKNRWNKYTRI